MNPDISSNIQTLFMEEEASYLKYIGVIFLQMEKLGTLKDTKQKY